MTEDSSPSVTAVARHLARVLLAAFLVVAGISHFVIHDEFLAQTPTWLPARSAVIWVSGVVEIVLGIALVLVRRRRRELGLLVAGFFVLVFPGNVYQAVAGTDGFGLDTPAARWTRLAFQPVLIAWAIVSTRR
jgi:uncharacterized membrane protein